MSLTVTFDVSPIDVTINAQPVVVTFSNVGVQGATGPAGPAGTGVTWNEITVSTVSMAINNGYLMNNASQVIGTLPATAAQFSVIRVAGKGAGGWKIAQNAGQTIHFDSSSTTTGIAGYLASQNTFDCVDLLCVTANTDFLVTSSIGNISGA